MFLQCAHKQTVRVYRYIENHEKIGRAHVGAQTQKQTQGCTLSSALSVQRTGMARESELPTEKVPHFQLTCGVGKALMQLVH